MKFKLSDVNLNFGKFVSINCKVGFSLLKALSDKISDDINECYFFTFLQENISSFGKAV